MLALLTTAAVGVGIFPNGPFSGPCFCSNGLGQHWESVLRGSRKQSLGKKVRAQVWWGYINQPFYAYPQIVSATLTKVPTARTKHVFDLQLCLTTISLPTSHFLSWQKECSCLTKRTNEYTSADLYRSYIVISYMGSPCRLRHWRSSPAAAAAIATVPKALSSPDWSPGDTRAWKMKTSKIVMLYVSGSKTKFTLNYPMQALDSTRHPTLYKNILHSMHCISSSSTALANGGDGLAKSTAWERGRNSPLPAFGRQRRSERGFFFA